MSSEAIADTLRWQFSMTWGLLDRFYLPGLSDELCVWMPHASATTVRRDGHGGWIPDWDEAVVDPAPPATIAWLTWHIQWWLGDAIAEARQQSSADRQSVVWPGSAAGVCAELRRLAGEWMAVLQEAGGWDLDRSTSDRWPEPLRPLHRLMAWVNMEMMKNVAEIGHVFREAVAHDVPRRMEIVVDSSRDAAGEKH